jgi:hypothetical protein
LYETVGLEPEDGVGKCCVVTGVIGGDNIIGVAGFENTSFARYGGDLDPRDGEDGGDEFGRNGDELKYEEDEEDGVNTLGGGELSIGDECGCRLKRA